MILIKRGEEAKLVGIQKVIDQLRIEEEMNCFSEKAQQKEPNLFRVSLFCCFILLLLILMFNMKD